MAQTGAVHPFNILLDKLPDDYKGWLIRTDYRIGIQLSQCLKDENLKDNERFFIASYLLYGIGSPPIDIAAEGILWFLRCGEEERNDIPIIGEQLIYFDFDHARIMASFKQSHGIWIHREKLHWFEFRPLLDSLNKDSSMSNAIEVRGTDTSSMKGKQKAAYDRVKKILAPPEHFTEEEQAVIDEFNSLFK